MTGLNSDGAVGPEDTSGGGFGAPAPLEVKLEIFEGPLDLLLHLIRKNEIEITDIPIIQVTDQYMEYLRFMKELDLDLASDYLVMASTLVHIKSKMLLPPEPVEEDGEAEDPRAELVRQLLEYQKFKHVAEDLRERQRLEQASFPRGGESEFEVEEELLFETSVFDLVAAFKSLLERSGEPETLTIETYRLSVADRVQELMDRLGKIEYLGFSDLFLPKADRHEWIVTFLALLELARVRVIRIVQRGRFAEIGVSRREPPKQEQSTNGSDSA